MATKELPNVMRVRKTTNTPNSAELGEIRYADGVSWAPADGAGLYYYNGSSWVAMKGSDLSGYLTITGLLGGAQGWRDQLGNINVRGAGASAIPSWELYRGNIYQWEFSGAGDREVVLEYHIQHDYKPNSDLYLHVHWSQNVVDASKQVEWMFDISYAKGHDQAAFSAPFTTSVTQGSSSTQYQHMIAEVQITAASPSATQFASSLVEPDGVLLVRCWRNSSRENDTLTQPPFLHYCDLHYQVDRLATLNKVPNFYSS